MTGSASNSTSASVPVPQDLARDVERAFSEDVGAGDLTAALIPESKRGRASIITREDAIVCGIPYVEQAFKRMDPGVAFEWKVREGEEVKPNQLLFNVAGNARALLTAERTALNFLQLLSGTATMTHQFAKRLEGTGCRLLDTRKTIPTLRTAQKYAVRVGGGHNHRMGLFDGILIKENHIMAAGSISEAVKNAKKHSKVPVEVEVETLEQLKEAIDVGADIALLDNFSLEKLRAGVALNKAHGGKLKLEASGGVSLDTIRAIGETGVDFVSVGGITKNVHGTDLSMRFDWT